jgi:putative aminopeptidase
MNRFGKALGVCALAAATSSCAAPYYWQAIGGQIELLRKREPIDEVIADPAADPTLKSTLARVETMRRFAVDELDLPSNDSYTTYVALDRPYVVWNVVAAEEFSVDPQRWCFPFAGCVAYRGYFDKARADRFAAKLAEDGLDTSSVCTSRTTANSARRLRWSSRSSARSAGCPSTERPRISSDIARGASVASNSASSLPRNKLGSGLSTRAALRPSNCVKTSGTHSTRCEASTKR